MMLPKLRPTAVRKLEIEDLAGGEWEHQRDIDQGLVAGCW